MESPSKLKGKIDRKSYQTLYRAATLLNEQAGRLQFAMCMRAFRRWQVEFPMALKCDELSRQLRERGHLLESIRSCYLKDVVGIKFYLDQLTKVKESKDEIIHEKLEEWRKGAYDLHALPSADIRNLINNAQACVGEQSNHMLENLIDIGIVDPELCRTLNPWEQSRGFRRLERLRKGPSHQFPSGGESVSLAAPHAFKVFVRPCRECAGVVSVVRSWNQEVEKCMNFYAEHGSIDSKVTEYKRVIKSLQSIVEEKEMEIIDLIRKNNLLENASQWFDKWSHTKDYVYQENIHNERITMYQAQVQMAEHDKQSTVWNLYQRVESQISMYQGQVKELEGKMQHINKERDIETTLRLQLNNNIQTLYTEKQALQSTIDRMTMQSQKDQNTIAELTAKVEQLTKINDTLNWSIETKDQQYEEYKSKMTTENENLTRQVNTLSGDYASKVDECDRLREDVRNKTKTITKYTNTINRLHEDVDGLKMQLNKKRVFKRFRTYVYCIIFLNKYGKGLASKALKNLGYMGSKFLVQILENRGSILQGQLLDLKLSYEQFQMKYSLLESNYEESQRGLSLLQKEYKSLQDQVTHLEQVIESKDKSIQEYMSINENLQGMVANYTSMISVMEQNMTNLFPATAQSKLNKFVIQRICYLYTSQRNLIHHLTCILFKVRCIIHNIDPLKGIAYVSKEQASVEAIYDNYISMMNLTGMKASNNPNKAEGGEGGSNSGSFALPSSSGGNSFSAELNQKFLGRRSSSLLYAQQQQQKKIQCVNILRGKTQRLMTYIVSHKPHNILYCTTLMREKWMQWIKEVESYANDDKPAYLSNKAVSLGESKEKSEEDKLKQILHRDIAVAMHFDYLTVSYIQTNITHDIYNIQHYIHTYKRAFNDAKEKLSAIHHKELEERKKRATDRSVISHTSSSHRQKKSRVMQIKQSYAHMLDTDLSGYLSNVLSAIETVQQTHGDIYYEGGNSKENTNANNSPGASTDNLQALVKQPSNKDIAEQPAVPTNAPFEIGETIGRPQSGGRRRNSLRSSTRASMWDISQVPMAVKEEDENMLTGGSVVSGAIDPNESHTIIQDLHSDSVHSKGSVHSTKSWKQPDQGASITSPLPSVHEIDAVQPLDNLNTDLSTASVSSARSATSAASRPAAPVPPQVEAHSDSAVVAGLDADTRPQEKSKEAGIIEVTHSSSAASVLPKSPVAAATTAATNDISAPAVVASTSSNAAASAFKQPDNNDDAPLAAPVRRKSTAHLITRAVLPVEPVLDTNISVPEQPAITERSPSSSKVSSAESINKSQASLETQTSNRGHAAEEWEGGPGKLTSVASVAQLKLLRSKKSSPVKSSADMLKLAAADGDEPHYDRIHPSPPRSPPVPAFPKEIPASVAAPPAIAREPSREDKLMPAPPPIVTSTASSSSVLGTSPAISRPSSPKRPRPHTPLQSASHDADDDDLDRDILDVEDEEDEVDDMQVLHKEIVMIMKRDKDQTDQINELTKHLQETQQLLANYTQELPRLQDRVNQLFNDNLSLKEDMGKIIGNYEETKHENSLLRELIYDSYRYQSKEIESILAKMQTSMETKVNRYEKMMHKRLVSTADQGTQITCSVCTIREYHQPAAAQDKLDSTGRVRVHEVLSSALGGNVKVLYPSGDFQSAMRRDTGYVPEPSVAPNNMLTTSQTTNTNTSYIEKVMSVLQSNPTSSTSQAIQTSAPSAHPAVVSNAAPQHTSFVTRSTMEAPPAITHVITKKDNKIYSSNDPMMPNMNAGIAGISSIHISHSSPSPSPSYAQNNPIPTQILFDYAKSLLKQNRPRSALNAASTHASGLPRPLSGLPGGGGGDRPAASVTFGRTNDDGYGDTYASNTHANVTNAEDGSKFRKIKQIPRSHSADPNNASNADIYTPHTQTERQKQTQQRSDVNTAALLQDTQYIHPLGQKSLRDDKKRRVMSASALPSGVGSESRIKAGGTMQYSKSAKTIRHSKNPYHPNDNKDDEFVISDDDSKSFH